VGLWQHLLLHPGCFSFALPERVSDKQNGFPQAFLLLLGPSFALFLL